MSSTNKTSNLMLNSWNGSDIPEREDFNRDNAIIDDAINSHVSNGEIHITNHERFLWNNVFYISQYVGNGAATRTIQLDCPFAPTFGVVFAVNMTPAVTDFSRSANYNYCAFFSLIGSSMGVSIDGKNLTVNQSSIAVLGNEYKSLNDSGTRYICVSFR